MKYNQKNIQDAKAAAQRLYKKFNFDGGNLQSYQISSLMQQTYDFLKISYKPNSNDVKEYAKVLDANKDGQVNLKDLEQMAITYLCGQGVLNSGSSQKSLGNQYNYQTSQTSYTSNNTIQNKYAQNNYQTNQYSSSNSQFGSSAIRQQSSGYTFSGTRNIQQSPEHITSKQSNQPKYQQQYFQKSPMKSKYTEGALQYLNITRSLFNKYCNKQTNTITRDKVVPLLTETYGSLGRKGYHPSEEDVNVWMKLCDTNNDGHVEQAEYQYFVVRALERSGIQVYNQ